MSNRFSPFQLVVILWLAMISLVGCTLPSGDGAGPSVWIDRPLNGESVPLAAVIIQAHASDADGITKIEFLISDSLISSVSTEGARLEEASIEWMPPAPGVYTLNVRATDTQGNSNALTPASVQITVGSGTSTPTPAPASGQCAAETLVAPLLLSPADGAAVTGEPLLAWSYPDASCHPYSYAVDISSDASFTDTSLGFGTLDYNETSRQWPLPAGQCYYWRARAYVPDVSGPASGAWTFCLAEAAVDVTSTPASALTGSVIQFWADPPEVQAGACTDIHWHVENIQKVIFGGIDQSLDGSYEDCLCESQRYTLTVVHLDGFEERRQVNVNVTGSCAVPVTATFLPIDTTPPSISDMTANPALISVQTQCGATPPTTVIHARVTDDGGIARVVARVSGVGEFDMASAGGGYYQVTLGPFSEAGTLSIFVQAQDNAGNTATSAPIEVQVVACPG
jgi:hypothetical protein